MNAIEIKNLRKSFKDFEIDGIDLVLPSGCIMGLIGENGAGKSTVIKLILGILEKDSGTVKLFGKDSSQNMCLMKEDIGIVPDEVGIPSYLDAKKTANIMRRSFAHWDDDEYNRLLEKLSVPKNKKFSEMSRGMKMKLGIAIAMSHNAKLLILDEATNGLDPVVRDEVLGLFWDFTRKEDHSILISSHIVSDLEKICDYIVFLKKGKLMLSDEKDELLSRYGAIICAKENLHEIPEKAIVHKKETPYGVELVVKKSEISGLKVNPISIEELFLVMAKEGGAL